MEHPESNVWSVLQRNPKTFSQGTHYGRSHATQAATVPLKMFLGRDYVRVNTNTNMIFDELVVYDRPLTQGEVQQILQGYNQRD